MTPEQQRDINLRIRAQDQTGKTVKEVRKNIKGVAKAIDEQSAAASRGELDIKKLESAMKQLDAAQTAVALRSESGRASVPGFGSQTNSAERQTNGEGPTRAAVPSPAAPTAAQPDPVDPLPGRPEANRSPAIPPPCRLRPACFSAARSAPPRREIRANPDPHI